jgi:hypothetical protein
VLRPSKCLHSVQVHAKLFTVVGLRTHFYTQPFRVHVHTHRNSPQLSNATHNLPTLLDDLVGVLPRQQRVRRVSFVLLLAIRVGRSSAPAGTLLEHVLRTPAAAGERDDLCALLVVLQD